MHLIRIPVRGTDDALRCGKPCVNISRVHAQRVLRRLCAHGFEKVLLPRKIRTGIPPHCELPGGQDCLVLLHCHNADKILPNDDLNNSRNISDRRLVHVFDSGTHPRWANHTRVQHVGNPDVMDKLERSRHEGCLVKRRNRFAESRPLRG